jgi:hypothetical protein
LSYIGNIPAESYASFETETFSVSATANYTLSHAVTNENEIRLVINGVVQQPGSGKAYTASGTTLTLTSATVSGDSMYAVYLGRALQTVNPPNASVGSAQIADSLISGKTALGATPADTDELLISDAGTLKRVDFSHLKSANTPAFQAYRSSTQTISGSTWTKVQFNTEIYDTDSDYDNSTNYRFTPTTAGKYFCYFMVNSSWTGSSGGYDLRSKFQKNGGNITGYTDAELIDFGDGANINLIGTSASGYAVINFNGSTDYLEVYHRSTAPTPFVSGASYFGAYKIIE